MCVYARVLHDLPPKAQWYLSSKETRKLMPWLKSIFSFTLIPSCATKYDGIMCNCQSLNEFHERNFHLFLLFLSQTVQSELKIKVQIFCIIFCFSRYSKFSTHHNLQDCWNREKILFFWSHLLVVLEHKQKREHDVLYTPPASGWLSQEDCIMYHGMHLHCNVEIDMDIVFKTSVWLEA